MARKGKREAKAPPLDTEDENVVVLQDEEGKESSFKILFDSLFVGDKQYVVLMPVDQEDSLEPEIVILRVDETDDGESILATIDDDDEWEEVLEAFEEMDIQDNLGEYDIDVQEEEDPKRKEPRS